MDRSECRRSLHETLDYTHLYNDFRASLPRREHSTHIPLLTDRWRCNPRRLTSLGLSALRRAFSQICIRNQLFQSPIRVKILYCVHRLVRPHVMTTEAYRGHMGEIPNIHATSMKWYSKSSAVCTTLSMSSGAVIIAHYPSRGS